MSRPQTESARAAPQDRREVWQDAAHAQMLDEGAPDREYRYLAAVAAHSDASGRPAGRFKDGTDRGLSVAAIAAKMKRSVSTVHRARRGVQTAPGAGQPYVGGVERRGVLEVERRHGRPNLYHLRHRQDTMAYRLARQRSARAKDKRDARADKRLGWGLTARPVAEPDGQPRRPRGP